MTSIKEFCFVIDRAGNKLDPTNKNKGWYLIRQGKAKQINKFPMVIQLNREIDSNKINSDSKVLGIDDGSKFTGIGIVQVCKTKNKPLVKGTIEHRQDVKHLMDARRGYRKYHRSHKPYRPKRFDNRKSSKRRGRLAPSLLQKRQATLRVLNQLTKWIQIDKIILEDVQIDIRALTDGFKPYRWQYQKSNRLDENLRIAALMRDNYTCQECGKQYVSFEVHHIIPRRFNGNNSIYNLITLCSDCHNNITGIELSVSSKYQEIIKGKNINLVHAQHVMQGKKYLREQLSKIALTELTTGADTANKRIDWNIKKTHSNDALVICSLILRPEQCEIREWTIKPQRRKSKSKTNELQGFRHRDFIKYSKKNGIAHFGYIISLFPKRMQCTFVDSKGKRFDQYGVNRLKLIWRFNKVYWF